MPQPEPLTASASTPSSQVPAIDIVESGPVRRRTDIGLVLGMSWVVLVLGLAVLADILPLQDPFALNPGSGSQGPSAKHWLGADQLGRDMLSRLIYGARISLLVAFGATSLAGLVGISLGLLAGYFRRAAETLTMGAMDILLAFPALILAIALTSFLGASVRNVIIAIAILALPAFTRVARAQTLAIAQRDFVKASIATGAGNLRVLRREVAPNILPTMIAYGLVIVAVAIVVEGGLSFLGLSVSLEIPTWGGMINAGRGHLARAAHMSLVPAAALFVTVLAFNTVGEKLALRSRSAVRPG